VNINNRHVGVLEIYNRILVAVLQRRKLSEAGKLLRVELHAHLIIHE